MNKIFLVLTLFTIPHQSHALRGLWSPLKQLGKPCHPTPLRGPFAKTWPTKMLPSFHNTPSLSHRFFNTSSIPKWSNDGFSFEKLSISPAKALTRYEISLQKFINGHSSKNRERLIKDFHYFHENPEQAHQAILVEQQLIEDVADIIPAKGPYLVNTNMAEHAITNAFSPYFLVGSLIQENGILVGGYDEVRRMAFASKVTHASDLELVYERMNELSLGSEVFLLINETAWEGDTHFARTLAVMVLARLDRSYEQKLRICMLVTEQKDMGLIINTRKGCLHPSNIFLDKRNKFLFNPENGDFTRYRKNEDSRVFADLS